MNDVVLMMYGIHTFFKEYLIFELLLNRCNYAWDQRIIFKSLMISYYNKKQNKSGAE